MQILDAPVPQVGASIPAVLEQVIVQPLPEARVVEHVARVPLMAFPSLDVPMTGLHDPTKKEEVEEEEEVEVFDRSIDRFEHSGFRPRRLCVHFMAGRSEREWTCTFAHFEKELHPHERATDHGKFVAGVQTIPQEGERTGVPALRRKLSR